MFVCGHVQSTMGRGHKGLGDQWDACAHRELTVWLRVKDHSPSFYFSFSVKRMMWEEALSNNGNSLSWRRKRKWTIMTMTFRLILASGSSPSASPSPDLFPVEETLQQIPPSGGSQHLLLRKAGGSSVRPGPERSGRWGCGISNGKSFTKRVSEEGISAMRTRQLCFYKK